MNRWLRIIRFVPARWRPSLDRLIEYLRFRYRAAILEREERDQRNPEGGLPLPPPLLRFRVHGALDRQSFLRVGEAVAKDAERALIESGRDLSSFRSVLDFGCGCARVLRWFAPRAGEWDLHGTDADPRVISWCRKSMKFASFRTNRPLPPLPYPSGMFDLILAISVFTHLDEAHQFSWLSELGRVAKPGAILLASTHGEEFHPRLSPAEYGLLHRRGFLFQVQETGSLRLCGMPDYYQVAYHTRQYVAREWSRIFQIVRHVERGLNRKQDLVVLRHRG